MRTEKDLRSLVEDWIEAWNAKDLNRIMRHYASSVVFEANTVVRRWSRPDGILRGADELREHFRMGLEIAPTLRFELEEGFTAPSGYAALYRRDKALRKRWRSKRSISVSNHKPSTRELSPTRKSDQR